MLTNVSQRGFRPILRPACALCLGAVFASVGCAATPTSPPLDHDQTTQAETNPPPALPGITLDREAGLIDLDATVIGHGCEWLELVACTRGSREHEALVTIDAKPSDLHVALLLLGLEPGTPQTGIRGEDGWTLVPPTGPAVDLHFLVPLQGPEDEQSDLTETLVPVESWVFDQATEAVLPDPTHGGWIFTGSRLVRDTRQPPGPDNPEVYLADVNGTVISLVHFGDETIGRDTTVTESNDGQNLVPHPATMPPNGTRVVLRISRVQPANP